MKKIVNAACAAVAALACASAQAGGHYVAGVEGQQGASVPPPGLYYLGYLVHYDIDRFSAPGGRTALQGENSGSVNALANRFVWVSEHKLLGADWGVEAIVPVLRKSLYLGAIGYSDRASGLGDVFLSPLVLGWHGTRWDAVAAAGLWLDTARDGAPAAPGHGFRSTMLTLGGTLHTDERRTANVSALMRYERNGRTDAGFKPGSQVTVEWGVGRMVGPMQLGVVGYDQWQVGSDSGPAATSDKTSRHAAGGEVVWPLLDKGLFLKAAAYKEYRVSGGRGAEPKGALVRFTVVKAF